MICVGGRLLPLSQITARMVEEEMDEQEQQAYTQLVQELYAYWFLCLISDYQWLSVFFLNVPGVFFLVSLIIFLIQKLQFFFEFIIPIHLLKYYQWYQFLSPFYKFSFPSWWTGRERRRQESSKVTSAPSGTL